MSVSHGCFETGDISVNAKQRDDTEKNLELVTKVFEICDSNGDDVLTWPEVEDCEEKYCKFVAFRCPSQQDFDAHDTNGDGMMTWDEYVTPA